MKLSEMNTEKLADVLAELAEPMERICTDEGLNKKLEAETKKAKTGKQETRTVLQMAVSTFSMFAPVLLVNHRDDMYKVISVMTDKTAEEIKNQKGMQTIKDVKSFVDKDFIDFFK